MAPDDSESMVSKEADIMLQGAAKLGIGSYGRHTRYVTPRERACYGEVDTAIRRADETLDHEPSDRVELMDQVRLEIGNILPGLRNHFKRRRAERFLMAANSAGRALSDVERFRSG